MKGKSRDVLIRVGHGGFAQGRRVRNAALFTFSLTGEPAAATWGHQRQHTFAIYDRRIGMS